MEVVRWSLDVSRNVILTALSGPTTRSRWNRKRANRGPKSRQRRGNVEATSKKKIRRKLFIHNTLMIHVQEVKVI
jgi:hypothetical protein